MAQIWCKKYCQRVSQSENCQEVSQSKERQGSATIKSISKKCHNQKFCQGVPQSWVQPKVHSGSDTIKSASRDCRNQKDCHRVSKSKALPGSVTTKSTARDHHSRKNCQDSPPSRKHLCAKVTPDFHLTYSKNGGKLGSESNDKNG